MRQVEVSRTLVFDDPRRARRFFEALVADNIDVGRPEQVAIVFARQVRKTTKEPFRSRIFTTGSDVKIDFAYKHSRVKQYLKDGRALRIEAVINKPWDLGVLARLEHLPELVAKARADQPAAAYHRACRPGLCHRHCALRAYPPALRKGGPANRRAPVRRSTRHSPGRRSRYHTPRRHRLHKQKPSRARRRAPRPGVHPSQMSYDLRRLRLHGLIQRVPGRNTYTPTPDGIRVAVFYTKLQNRLLQPLLDADKPPAPLAVRHALATLEHAVGDYVTAARLTPAAA